MCIGAAWTLWGGVGPGEAFRGYLQNGSGCESQEWSALSGGCLCSSAFGVYLCSVASNGVDCSCPPCLLEEISAAIQASFYPVVTNWPLVLAGSAACPSRPPYALNFSFPDLPPEVPLMSPPIGQLGTWRFLQGIDRHFSLSSKGKVLVCF